jgi:hypothetical protein
LNGTDGPPLGLFPGSFDEPQMNGRLTNGSGAKAHGLAIRFGHRPGEPDA